MQENLEKAQQYSSAILAPQGQIEFDAQAQFRQFVDVYTSQRDAQRNKKRTKEDVIKALAGESMSNDTEDKELLEVMELSPSLSVAQTMDQTHNKPAKAKPSFRRFFNIKQEKQESHTHDGVNLVSEYRTRDVRGHRYVIYCISALNLIIVLIAIRRNMCLR